MVLEFTTWSSARAIWQTGWPARRKPDDGYLRETFTLPRERARAKARDFLNRYPKAAYMSGVESWRELPGGDIEFTMRRLPSAD